MKIFLRTLLLSLGVVSGLTQSAQAERPISPFKLSAALETRDGAAVARFQFTVPPDHVIYAERLRFETEDGTELTPVNIPAPVVAIDKVTGKEKRMYDRAFAADVKLDMPLPVNLMIKFQGCSNSACYFPEKHYFSATTAGLVAKVEEPAPSEDAGQAAASASGRDWHAAAGAFTVVGRETGYLKPGAFVKFLNEAVTGQGLSSEPLGRFKDLGLMATLFLIVLGGLGLNLTPCVLPMIPINLAIIGAGSRASSRRRGFGLGAIYGAGMALAYGILGLVVVLTGAKFGTLNSSPWFNVAIAGIFVVMALGMFDVFSIDLSRFQGGVGSTGGAGQKSQAALAFTLGAVAALLAGACVAPVVISVLLLAANMFGKGVIIGLALPFLLGLGMALPWPFAGAGLSFLPKPGKWMAKVKYGFGTLILVFALYYGHLGYKLSGIDRPSTVAGRTLPSGDVASELSNNESLARALHQARQNGRPVLIDFAASWCKNCAAMDEMVFPRDEVKQKLKDFVVVRYGAERPNESPAREVLDRFGVMGLPTYVVLKPAR
jgi:thiol:disulfide interchange protein